MLQAFVEEDSRLAINRPPDPTTWTKHDVRCPVSLENVKVSIIHSPPVNRLRSPLFPLFPGPRNPCL